MKRPTNHRAAMFLLAGLFTMTAWAGHSAQDSAGGTGLVILDFKPAFDDLMTMLVQPRHIKLYYAGHEENWALAQFQLIELRAAFVRIGDTIPDYGVYPVDSAVETVIAEPMNEVETAIASQDHAAFERAYVGLTAACNACHEAMNFPFLVMKVPDASADAAYVDQDFRRLNGPQ